MHIRGVFTNIAYDETPLTIRQRVRMLNAAVADGCATSKEEATTKARVGKLFCMEFEVAVLTQEVAHPDRWRCNVMPISCPVQILERGTGEVLKHCVDFVTSLPFLHELRTTPPDVFAVDISCADRAAANGRCEDGLYSKAARCTKRLRLPCFAHTSSTSQGRGYAVVASDFTGLIAMSLAMGGAGSDEAFRDCLVAVLLASFLPALDSSPLSEHHEAVVYLRGFLLDRLPASQAGHQRLDSLMSLLTGDIWEPYVQLRVPGGERNVNREAWARAVATALFPCAIGVCPRHRWCNSLQTLQTG